MQPKILSYVDSGVHNADLSQTVSRLKKEAAYKDLSTILIIPAFGSVPFRVVMSWIHMMTPPNQAFHRIGAQGMEVGEAYSSCIENILNHPQLSKSKYILTMEHDNAPPSDGLIKLIKQMEAHPEFACIGGLYFTKGLGGCAQIWGDPKDPVLNFRPQLPDPNGGLVECCGTGMGFNLWRLSMFKDQNLRKPWFKTTASTTEGTNTQDLYFWNDARRKGYRCAIDCSVLVGHYDLEGKFGFPDTMY